LSQRLALDSDTTKYYYYAPNPVDAMKVMHEQIAKHMRVCMTIDDGIGTLRGIAPSEPILSEAASRIMSSDRFSLLAALEGALSGYCINRGYREELLVAAFFTWARDRCVKIKIFEESEKGFVGKLCPYFSVTDLFQHLFTKSECKTMFESKPSLCHIDESSLLFGAVFKNAKMHFNHFIRPQDQAVLGLPYLLHIMVRGAAALGANCQPGFDAAYPFLYNTTLLDIKKVGFILVQVGNRSTKSDSRSLDDLFLTMDPFNCKLIKDEKDGRFPIPIIRILFLLSGNGSYLKQHTSNIDCKQSRFTSYDFVCSGVGEDILLPTQGASSRWRQLVDGADDWMSLYNVGQPNILRSQLPASANHAGHFTNWSDKVSLFEGFC
jgi:hypothetical protein